MGYRFKRCEVDWFRIICDLNKFNLSLKAMADIIQVPKPTIVGWKQGAEPKYSDGVRLVTLWCQVTGRDIDNLPKFGVIRPVITSDELTTFSKKEVKDGLNKLRLDLSKLFELIGEN